MKLTGIPVSIEQAKDIISRTDDSIENIVTFVIKNGNVTMTFDHDTHHFDVDLESNVDVIEVYRDVSKEQGISNEWVIEFGNKFKPIIDEFFKKD